MDYNFIQSIAPTYSLYNQKIQNKIDLNNKSNNNYNKIITKKNIKSFRKEILPGNNQIKFKTSKNSPNKNMEELNREYFKENKNIKIILTDEQISNQNQTIKVRLINSTENMTCIIGDNDKCQKCSNNSSTLNCGGCNEGYFLTKSTIFSKKRCRKCNDECNNNCYDDENGKISCYPDEKDFNTNSGEVYYDISDSSEYLTEEPSRRYLLSIELQQTKFISKVELNTTDFSSKELITQNLSSLSLPKNELTELSKDISHIQNNDFLTKDLSENEFER